MAKYDDILLLSRPKSTRTPMPRDSRAVQFSPFAALTGFEAAVTETARQTGTRAEQDDYATEQLNRAVLHLLAHPEAGTSAAVTYFIPDEKKEGGHYQTVYGIRKIHPETRWMLMEDGSCVDMDSIVQISGVLAE